MSASAARNRIPALALVRASTAAKIGRAPGYQAVASKAIFVSINKYLGESMRGRSGTLAAFAVLALAAGCAPKDEAPAVDLAAEEKAVWDRSAEWQKLAQAKDTAAIIDTVYLPDAITIFDGNLRKGSAEIKAGLDEEMAQMPDATLTWSTTSIRLASSGDMAWEAGAFTFDPDGAGDTASVSGNFVTVWTKVDGVWRVAADSGSSTKPAGAPADTAG